ncbi:MAG: MFS transporter [Acidaminococcaceae bacterium]
MNQRYVYLVAAGHFFCDIAMGALPAILPFLILYYGMDYSAISGLMFASSFLSSMVQPIFGWLADHSAKTWLMSLGIFLSGMAMGLVGLFEDYWSIFALVTVSGIGNAIFHPEAARIINRLSGAKRGTALSIFSVGGNGGFAAGPIIAVSVITFLGMKGIVVFSILATIISTLLIFVGPKIELAIAKSDFLNDSKSDNSLSKQYKNKNDWHAFARLTLIIGFSSIVVCGLRSFIPLYLVKVTGISTAAAGSALTLLFMLGVATTFIGGFLADRIGYLKVVQFSYWFLAPMIALLSQTTNAYICFLLMIPIGFAMFSPFSSIVVLGQNYLAKSVGFASGVTLGLYFSIGGVVVPLIGMFADKYGLPKTMEILAFFALLSALCTFLLPKQSIGDGQWQIK